MDGAIIKRRSQRALTLLEAIVAIGLLALATLSLLTVIVGGMKLMARSNEMAAANDVAKSTLEAIKRDFKLHEMDALPPGVYTFDGRISDPADSTGPNTFPPAPYPSVTVSGIQYNLVVEGLNEGTRIRRVKVSVYWDDDTPLVLETLLHP
jgi:type II secretory pathway pseudopilin PulG